MELIISINDFDADKILQHVAASYGWKRMTADEIAAKLSDQIKSDIAERAANGKEVAERLAARAEVVAVTDRSLAVNVKV